MTPIVTHDAEVDAAYIRFSPQRLEESEEVAQGIVLDYDKDGRIVAWKCWRRSDISPSDRRLSQEDPR